MQHFRSILLVTALMLGAVPSSGTLEGRSAREAHARLDGALAKKGMSSGSAVYIRIFKAEAELEVWLQRGAQYELFKTYPICAQSGTPRPERARG